MPTELRRCSCGWPAPLNCEYCGTPYATPAPEQDTAMRFIHACACGHEQEVTEAETRPASVVRCAVCRQVWGCVRARHGQPVWVRISEGEVEFHEIMREPDDAADTKIAAYRKRLGSSD